MKLPFQYFRNISTLRFFSNDFRLEKEHTGKELEPRGTELSDNFDQGIRASLAC